MAQNAATKMKRILLILIYLGVWFAVAFLLEPYIEPRNQIEPFFYWWGAVIGCFWMTLFGWAVVIGIDE